MKLNRTSTRYTQISMVVLCLVFTVYLIYDLNRNYTLSPYMESGGTVVETRTVDQPAAIVIRPITDYDVILDRPLFSTDRQPYVLPVRPVSTLTADNNDNRKGIGDYLLTAIIITDDNRIALIKSNKGNLFRLGVGESIDGWTLATVEAHEVSLNRGSEIKILELQVIKSPNRNEKTSPLVRPPPLRDEAGKGTDTPVPLNESTVPAPGD